MDRRRTLLRSLPLCVAMCMTRGAFSSGTGVLTFGNPILGGGRPRTRQIVRLEGRAGQLIGYPATGPVAMIVAYVPGCAPDDLIIREEMVGGGTTLLQIATPPCFGENFVRATLFLRRKPRRVRFAKSDGSGWSESAFQAVPLPTLNKPRQVSFSGPAVVVDNLRLIQLMDETATQSGPPSVPLFWTTNFRTRIWRAAWHILWSWIALMTFSLLSWSAHKVAALAGRE